MAENTTNNKRNDEIDLLDLFRRMGRTLSRWFIALFNAFLHSIVFIIKRWLPLTIAFAVAIAASYFLKATQASFYNSDLVLRANSYIPLSKRELPKSNSITPSDLITFVNRNSGALINAISAREKMNNVVSIEAFWIIDLGKDGVPDFVDYRNDHNLYDTLNVRMKDRFDIRIKTLKAQDLSSVRNEIMSFINSDSLLRERNIIRLKQSEDMIKRLNYDIQQLDSLQKVKYIEESRNMKKNGAQIIFVQDPKIQLLYPDILTLYARKQALETDLDLYRDVVSLLNDFSSTSGRVNGVAYYAKTLVPSLFILTLIILIIVANRKKLREVYNKY